MFTTRLFCLPFVFVFGVFGHPYWAISAPPLHEQEVAAAWDAYSKGKFESAISHADIAIREFHRQALRDQDKLAAAGARVPNGRVNPQQKKEIHGNGVLNDIAAAYYVRGRSEGKLGRKEAAAKSLAEATKFPSARCWDVKGDFFWSPSEAAQRCLTNPTTCDMAPHEIYTAEAWQYYNQREYEKAMLSASRCIEEFNDAATEMQASLKAKNVRLPTGVVTDEMKKAIFNNGMLNDTATCYFILGKSAEAKKDKKAAAQAYHEAMKLPLGRCWDPPPRGWFWSPAEVSQDRLQDLR